MRPFPTVPVEKDITRTTAAQIPAISQPIRCVSQLAPLLLQKLSCSIACVLPEGQSVEFTMVQLCRIQNNSAVVNISRNSGNAQGKESEWKVEEKGAEAITSTRASERSLRNVCRSRQRCRPLSAILVSDA